MSPQTIRYRVGGSIMPTSSLAYLVGDDPRAALVEQAIDAIATGVTITVGGVEMHLAAWLDPDHWDWDWREAGIEDVDAFVAEQIGVDASS